MEEDQQNIRPTKNYIKQILNSNKIAIIGHSSPDADAISSSLALKRLIKQNLETENHKYIIDVFFDTDNFDDKYKPLIGTQRVNEQTVTRYDLAIALDCSSRNRLGKYDQIFKRAKDTLNIDHHETNDKFAKNNIVSAKCSSTCELLYLLLVRTENWSYTPDIYSLIYSGIITDTNNLTQNIGVNTLATIAEIMRKSSADGINLESIRDHFFKSNTPEQLSLLTRALGSISFHCSGEVASMKINKQDFAETNTTQEDTLGIVDYATKLQGVKIGILFIKQDDNTYYVSLRSKDNIDVGEIAKQMHGGGHQNIAAFSTTSEQNLTDVKNELFELCRKQLSIPKQEFEIGDLFVEVTGSGPSEEEIDNAFEKSWLTETKVKRLAVNSSSPRIYNTKVYKM